MKDFDEIFSSYLETKEADELFDGLFSAVWKAYMAGYKAAGGKVYKKQPLLNLVKCSAEKRQSCPKWRRNK